jgi:hypothetical protein
LRSHGRRSRSGGPERGGPRQNPRSHARKGGQSRRHRTIYAGDASWYGFADPLDSIESLRHSAAYLRDLLNRFGNLGLAAAAYNAGPTRVSAWLTSDRSRRADGAHLAAAFGAKRIVCAERGVGLELGIVGTRPAVEMRRFL